MPSDKVAHLATESAEHTSGSAPELETQMQEKAPTHQPQSKTFLARFFGGVSDDNDILYKQSFRGYQFALGLLTAISTATTGVGIWTELVSRDPNPLAYALFGLLLVGLPLAIISSWAIVMRGVLHKTEKSGFFMRLIPVVLSMFLIGGVFFASTSTSVMGIGGRYAVKAHMTAELDRLEKEIHTVLAFRDAESNLSATLGQYSAQWANIAEDDAKNGTYTGKPGEGPLYNYLMQSSSSLGGLQSAMIEHGGDAHRKAAVLSRDIAQAKTDVQGLTDEEAFQNQEEHIARIKKFFARVNTLSSESALSVVRPQIFNFGSMLVQSDTSASPAQLAARQKKAMQIFGEKFENTRQALIDEWTRTNATRPERVNFEYVNMFEAVIYYWSSVKTYWAISSVIDALPIIILLMLFYNKEAYVVNRPNDA